MPERGGREAVTTELIGQIVIGGLEIVIIAVTIYVGVKLKGAINAQKATIDAQAEHVKTLSTVIQDFERLNKTMKLVLDTVNDQVTLQREQAFKERVVRDTEYVIQRLLGTDQERHAQTVRAVLQEVGGIVKLVGDMLPFLYPGLRKALIDAADLPPSIKAQFQQLADGTAYTPVPDEHALEQVRRSVPYAHLSTARPDEEN
jgi:hypothetical protein